MANKVPIALKFKRRRSGVTDYRKRLALVKGGMLRLVVRKSNRCITGQIIKYSEKGDMVLKSVSSKELTAKEYGWPARSNRPTAYLTGMLLAKKAKELSDIEFVLDIGLSSPVKNSVPFAFAVGFKDAGMKLRSGIEMPNEYYNGTKIAEYASLLKKENTEAYGRLFSSYIKSGMSPEGLKAKFEEVKNKISSK